jgi:DNA-binding winged helix-turn-helix (wHTH) protein/Tfp pilus assembly protein PilF/TolB-like protein
MPDQYRFGPYLLDPVKGTLTRDGVPMKLTAKSLNTLAVLVRRHGETVAKGDLIDAVWGMTAVEENSLNQCISAVRKALGEQPGQNEYIVTVTGTGYRFVAPVEVLGGDSPAAVETASHTIAKLGFIPRAAGITAALTALAIGIYATHRAAESTGADAPRRRTAVILPLKNLSSTPDTAWLSTAVGEMLYHELAGSGPLRMIPPDDVARMQRDLPQRRSSEQFRRDIRNYTGADLALGGAVTVLVGSPEKALRIDLHVEDLRTGEIIATSSSDGPEEQTFSIVRDLAERTRKGLGIGAGSNPPNVMPIPRTDRAMQLYAQGLEALRSADFLGAKDRLLEAVAADPSNALCYSALSSAWSALGYDSKALDAAKHAFALSASLDQLDKLAIEGRYRFAAHEWQRAAGIYESILQVVPDSMEDAGALAEVYWSSGRSEQALRVLEQLRKLPAPLGDDPRIDYWEAQAVRQTWSDYPRVEALARRAAEKAAQRQMRGLYANALLLRQNAMSHAGMPGVAAIRSEAQSVCQDVQDFLCVAQALRSEGNHNLLNGELKEAEKNYNQALAIDTQIGQLGEKVNEWNGLGFIHWDLDDFAAAEGNFRDALHAREELGGNPAMILNNYGELLTAAGRLPEARRSLDEALKDARAAKEVDSEATSLADMAELERVEGHPRIAVELALGAETAAKKSGSPTMLYGAEEVLALAQSTVGETRLAEIALGEFEAQRPLTQSGDIAEFDFVRAAIRFDEGIYADAGKFARNSRDEARNASIREKENLAEALLIKALLAQNRLNEASAEALRVSAPPQAPEPALSRLETRLAELAANSRMSGRAGAGEFRTLAAEAHRTGYLELELEIELTAADQMRRSGREPDAELSLRQLQATAAARGYVRLAERARVLTESLRRR